MVCEYICSILDREVRGLKYLSGSESFPRSQVAESREFILEAFRLTLFKRIRQK